MLKPSFSECLSDTALAYIAGIIDGEGCITISRHRTKNLQREYYHLSLRVKMVDSKAISFIVAKFGGKIYSVSTSQYNRRQSVDWVVTGDDAKRILLLIKPYLLIKIEQAEIGLLFCDKNADHTLETERCCNLQKKMMLLNRRGLYPGYNPQKLP
jgi:hypothetical protein